MISKFYILFMMLLYSCSSSYITSTWKDKEYVPLDYGKMMVVGIIRDADRSVRSIMENYIVNDLKDRGYQAYSAFEEYGPKALQGMDEEQVKNKLVKEGVDAVITVVLLDKQRERYYVPGHVYYSPYMTYQNRFWGYYRSIYSRIETPGYYQQTAKYFWESNFYDLHSKKLVYSVQTESFDPASAESMAHEYGKNIVQSLLDQNVLKPHSILNKPV
jgi:hypothetical protein